MTEADFNRAIDTSSRMWQLTALGVTGNAADADEAVQEALIAAWRKRGAFRNDAQLSSWICRIVIRRACNLLRRRRREAARQAAWLANRRETAGPPPVLDDELKLAMERLPGLYRETLELFIVHELDPGRAAEAAGCVVKTFYWRLDKARKLLKKELETT